ncbi:MAG: carboxypeptidase-like regulatory domain-containing protein, partial [Chitinophagales bacterium]|nr:carboxypeptidase-like regulatory domain-containing protein [Chitinophagales bacterium]
MKFGLLPLLFILINSVSVAQTGIIYGTVNNSLNNEPLPFVTIIISGTNIGTVTDDAGNYKIENLAPGLYNLEFSFIGFKKKNVFEIQVTNAKPYILNIVLEEEISQLETVEIKAPITDKTEESPLSLRTIGSNEIQRNPGGNRDISRVIQSLPGVTYTASFRNDIIIRGG